MQRHRTLIFSDLLPLPIGRAWSLVLRVFMFCMVIALFAMPGKGGPTAAHAAPAQPAISSGELMHDLIATPSVTSMTHNRVIWMQVTAYCPCTKCCGPHAAGITASGKLVSYNAGRFVAADTSILPFGTKVLIPGYGNEPVEVIDRGSAIKGNHLDVFFATHEQAMSWGRQWIPITVVE